MHKIFRGVSTKGIVEPGHVYILCDCEDRGWPPEPIEYLYVIKEEREILLALDMELCIVMAESYEAREFLGIRKVNDDCHEFNMLCYEKDSGEEVKYTLYLQRIQSFEESLAQVKDIFGVD